jgi:hypothetical protein
MKLLTLLGIIFAVLTVTAYAAAPITVITLDANQCKSLLDHLWPNQIKAYDTQIEKPFSPVRWFNLTDIKVSSITAGECKIFKQDPDIYRLIVRGINAKITAEFAYLLKEGTLPSLTTDKGSITIDINGAQLFSRVNLVPQRKSMMSSFLSMMKKFEKDGKVAEIYNSDWSSDVATIIPKMTITVDKSKYAELYNKLIAQHIDQLRLFTSVMINEQLGEWVEYYCNDVESHHCQEQKPGEFLEFIKKFTPNIVVGAKTSQRDMENEFERFSHDYDEESDSGHHKHGDKPAPKPIEPPKKPEVAS